MVTHVLMSESFIFAAVPVGQLTMFVYTSNKTNVILSSVILYLYMDGFLKVKALRMASPVYFRLWATFFYERYRASMTKHRQQHKG